MQLVLDIFINQTVSFPGGGITTYQLANENTAFEQQQFTRTFGCWQNITDAAAAAVYEDQVPVCTRTTVPP